MAPLRFKIALISCLVLTIIMILSCFHIDSRVIPVTMTISPDVQILWTPCEDDMKHCEASNLPLLTSIPTTAAPTTTSSPPTTTSAPPTSTSSPPTITPAPPTTTSTPPPTSSAPPTTLASPITYTNPANHTSPSQERAFTMELQHRQNEVKPHRRGAMKETIKTEIGEVSKQIALTQSSSKPRKARGPQARRTVVLQVSLGRSGSSFVGQIMNAHEDVFYIFEPLSILLKRIASSESSSVARLDTRTLTDFLTDIVTCNFHRQELVRRNFIRFVKWSLSSEISSQNLTQLKPRFVHEACTKHRYMVIKLLSLRLPSNGILALQDLFASLSHIIDFKIVHLVRDPRAVLASWKRLKWKAAAHPKYMCEEVLRNVRVGRSSVSWLSGRYKLFLYEEFCLQPLETSRVLYEYLGLRLHEGIKKSIRAMTAPAHSTRPGAYSVVRNSTAMVNKWKSLPKPFLKTVQRTCKGLIESLDYEVLIW